MRASDVRSSDVKEAGEKKGYGNFVEQDCDIWVGDLKPLLLYENLCIKRGYARLNERIVCNAHKG